MKYLTSNLSPIFIIEITIDTRIETKKLPFPAWACHVLNPYIIPNEILKNTRLRKYDNSLFRRTVILLTPAFYQTTSDGSGALFV